MSNKNKSTLKTAGAAAAGAVAGSAAATAAAHIPKSGFWGMSRDGEESNELEPLQFETENGTVTLRDENANGVYDAAVVEPSETEESEAVEVASVETQSEYEAIPASETTDEPAEFSALEVTAAPVSESDFDEMSFSEAFASAREELGPGGVFTWNGNAYNTFYKDEWEGMSSEEKQDYQAAVSQAGTENEHLNAVATQDEVTYDTVSDENEAFEAEPVMLDINEDGVEESLMVDVDQDGQYDAVLSDTNGDGNVDLVLTDEDHDGQMDSYVQDTDHDGQADESGSLPGHETEPSYMAYDDNYDNTMGNDYDNAANVDDMV